MMLWPWVYIYLVKTQLSIFGGVYPEVKLGSRGNSILKKIFWGTTELFSIACVAPFCLLSQSWEENNTQNVSFNPNTVRTSKAPESIQFKPFVLHKKDRAQRAKSCLQVLCLDHCPWTWLGSESHSSFLERAASLFRLNPLCCRVALSTSGPSWTASSASLRRTQRAKRQGCHTCVNSLKTANSLCWPPASCISWVRRGPRLTTPPNTSASSITE